MVPIFITISSKSCVYSKFLWNFTLLNIQFLFINNFVL